MKSYKNGRMLQENRIGVNRVSLKEDYAVSVRYIKD